MLTAIKERASGWIAWALVILISIPFALWGINSYFEGASKISVASVNGVDVEESIYQQALSEQRRSLVQMMGRNVDAELFASEAFKLQVLESLIDSQLQAEYLADRGYRITNEQLSNRIATFAAFQSEGHFDPARYEMLLQNAGLTVEGFERQQRQQGAVDQLRIGLRATSLVIPAMTDRAIQLLMQQRRAQYTVLDLQTYSDTVKVAEGAVRAEYEKNPDRYVQLPQMQVDYLALSVDALAAQAVITAAAKQAYYDDNTDRFTRPGSRSASHILISVPADAAEEGVEQARDEAAALVVKARDGQDFGELARKYSSDPGSAGRGGDLGIIRPGTMTPAFEAGVFALDQGQISDPVRTEYGWHVIKLTDLRQSVVSPFAEVQSEITGLLSREWAEGQFMVMAEDFQNMVFEQPGSLEATSDFLGIPIQRTGWFSLGAGEGIAAHAVVREAAFSDEVRVDRMNSEMIEIDSDTLVAVHYADYREQRQRDFEEVGDAIADDLAVQAALAAQEAAARQMIDSLRSGAQWAAVLDDAGLPAYQLPEDAEDISDPDDENVARAVYSAPAPVSGQAGYGGTRLDGSRYSVFRLEEVVSGDPSQITSEEREQIRALIGARVGEELYTGASRALRSAANVEVFNENL
ncbi:MAG TPA: hypothetical protein DG761_04455 [Gammaproteobacteria bacterium]|jgi:peptidyl-prolyl cis-trans isomerase D|nr:SurA N-terminal domain-containing protein [Arenicellales bacterium]MDP6552679.1 SurA N-terminal domain-containing protein [Arenicellales bacterium]MDP6791225.1 SurA N-terminal domain-containing protein [Arenicellales bacterium]MDP6917842.1 SurA N-terminal domain-containing protein [Arenicellales bacterium]HCX87253.1 hypothetical protein [Gammaproteobacteria bacterium]|tara:strand:- start:18570 stop:20483 length:1914 start_codon:yes stop_codon:yes gene_type:complete